MLSIKPEKYKDIETWNENQLKLITKGMISKDVAFSSLGKIKQRILVRNVTIYSCIKYQYQHINRQIEQHVCCVGFYAK